MTDWQAAIHTYIAQHPGARTSDIVAALGCTEAEALSSLSDTAWDIPSTDLPLVLTQIADWERIMVLVRNAGAVAEVEVAGQGGQVSGEWLNWIAQGYNLHIHIAATDQVLALVRPGKRGLTYSFNLVNHTGQVFCRFYARSQDAKAGFLNFCQAYMPHKQKAEVP